MIDFLPVILYPLLALSGLVGMWVAVAHLGSFIGGWRELSQLYPSPDNVQGTLFLNQSAKVGGARYCGVLILIANSLGFRLELIRPFHFGSSPIFIPWSDVTGSVENTMFGHYITITSNKAPFIPVTIHRKLAEELLTESSGNWDYEIS